MRHPIKTNFLDHLRYLHQSPDAPPRFFGRLDQLECQAEERRARYTVTRALRAVTHRREGRFDRVRGAQMLPVFSREIVKRQQFVAILRQLFGHLRVLCRISVDEVIECNQRISARGCHPDLLHRLFGPGLL